MNVYFDTEFTGLVPNTSLISIGCTCTRSNGTKEKFYAEFTDYNEDLCDEWINKNVIANLAVNNEKFSKYIDNDDDLMYVRDDTHGIRSEFEYWLHYISYAEHEKIVFVSDVAHYDMYLICNLFGGVFNLPEYVVPTVYDINQRIYDCYKDTYMFRGKNMADGMSLAFDLDRESLVSPEFKKRLKTSGLCKHNSLYDAIIIQETDLSILSLKLSTTPINIK